MSKIKVAALAAIMLALLSVALLHEPRPPTPQPFASAYLSIADSDVSWLAITEDKGQIHCIWNKVQVGDNGNLQQQQLSLAGTVSGDSLALSGRVAALKPIHVSAAGLREGPDIRMTLRIGENIIYTGKYAPSDSLNAAAAVLRFKQSVVAAAPPTAPKQELSAEKMAQLDALKQGKYYIRKVREFITSYKVIEAGYKRNTARMKDYLENVRRAEEAGSKLVRDQLIAAMRGIASDTKESQNNQEAFIREYAHKIVPFANGLARQHKNCSAEQFTNNERSGEGSCDVFFVIQNMLYNDSHTMQKAVDELSTTYKAEYTAQLKIIEDADKPR